MLASLKKLISLPWRLKRRIENRNNILRLKKIVEEAAVANNMGDRKVKILFGPSFSPFHTLKIHDILLASLLAAKGAEISYLSCPFGLPMCNNCGGISQLTSGGPKLCTYCQRFERNDNHLVSHLEKFAKIYRPQDHITRTQMEQLEKTASRIADSDLEGFNFQGVPIGQYSFDLVRNKGYVSDITLIPDYHNLVRKTILSNLVFFTYFQKVLHHYPPDVVVTHDSFYAPWRILYDLSQKQKIDCYNYYPGMQNNTFFYAKNKVTFNLDMTPLFAKWKNRTIPESELKKIDKIFEIRGKNTIYDMPVETAKQDDEILRFRKIVTSGKPLAGLYTNVLWDIMTLNKDRVFSSIQESYIETVRFFASHPEYNLVIKPHPLDLFKGHESREQISKMIKKAFSELPENILLLRPNSPITSYDIIRKAQVSIVYTTTVGIESVILGTPTITVGLAPYSGQGFTIDPRTSEEYYELLRKLLDHHENSNKEYERSLAAKYYYLMNYVYWYDFQIIKYDFKPHRNRATVIPNSLPELLKLQDFNRLAEAIIMQQEVPFFDSHLE